MPVLVLNVLPMAFLCILVWLFWIFTVKNSAIFSGLFAAGNGSSHDKYKFLIEKCYFVSISLHITSLVAYGAYGPLRPQIKNVLPTQTHHRVFVFNRLVQI